MKSTRAIVALAACIAAACRAASPAAPVPGNLLACRQLSSDSERVHCYDAQVDKMSAPVAKAAVAPQPTGPAAKFGQETLLSVARPKAVAEEDAALTSSITALRPVARATYTVSLANGQVWRQEEASDISLFFRVGDSVRIEKGSMGSYRLSTGSTGAKNWVRVTRLQ